VCFCVVFLVGFVVRVVVGLRWDWGGGGGVGVGLCVCVRVRVHVCVCLCVCVCVCVCVTKGSNGAHDATRESRTICVHMYVCMCAYICMCMYVCVYHKGLGRRQRRHARIPQARPPHAEPARVCLH